MKKIFATLALSSCLTTADTVYEPTWESLESRETPAWWGEAKFGIFIHWGLYSVPAWAPVGEYAEWYQHSKESIAGKKRKRQKATQEFHKKVYGDRTYQSFRDDFHCKLFEPDHWADIFKQSGAKYVVLTAKHHDGYCLYPSKEASLSFGTPWNSVDSGPRRDLVGELTDSVREAGLKMGLYYSIWDWFNPYWTEQMQLDLQKGASADPDGKNLSKAATTALEKKKASEEGLHKYIHEVMYPQFKQLVTEYEPSIIFSDGDWWMGYDKWQTLPMLAWLFNNAANKGEVIINDRWGRVRKKHGDYFTTEYGSGFDERGILWEENRGIGHSFGYNINENLGDYNNREEIIYLLCDIVARGGNFLLDVGPTADGRIPVIMEQRLKEVGDWMATNGEAIYGAKQWKHHSQWSEGNIPSRKKGSYKTGFSILQVTLEPKKGDAVKTAWFTQKGKDLHVLLPTWPESGKLTIKDLSQGTQPTLSLLGSTGKVSLDGGTIDLTAITPAHLPKSGAPYVVKLEGVLP